MPNAELYFVKAIFHYCSQHNREELMPDSLIHNINISVDRATLEDGQSARMAMPRLCTKCSGRLFVSDISTAAKTFSIICRHCGFPDIEIG